MTVRILAPVSLGEIISFFRFVFYQIVLDFESSRGEINRKLPQ